MSYTIELTPEAQRTMERVRQLPLIVMRGIARAMDLQNQLTIAQMTERRLSFPREGPTTLEGLRVITNRLRSSIRATKAVIVGDGVESAIGSNVKYAGVHEFGFSGSVTVPAHQRRAPQADRFTFGGAQNLSRRLVTRLGAMKGRGHARQTSSGISQVIGHQRTVNLPARRFIGRTLEERLPNYSAAISAEIVSGFERGQT